MTYMLVVEDERIREAIFEVASDYAANVGFASLMVDDGDEPVELATDEEVSDALRLSGWAPAFAALCRELGIDPPPVLTRALD
jgi:hypothetical protein